MIACFVILLIGVITDAERMTMWQSSPAIMIRSPRIQQLLKLNGSQSNTISELPQRSISNEVAMACLSTAQKQTLRQACLRMQLSKIYHDELLPGVLANYGLSVESEKIVEGIRDARITQLKENSSRKLKKLAKLLVDSEVATEAKVRWMIGEPFPFRRAKPPQFWSQQEIDDSRVPRIKPHSN